MPPRPDHAEQLAGTGQHGSDPIVELRLHGVASADPDGDQLKQKQICNRVVVVELERRSTHRLGGVQRLVQSQELDDPRRLWHERPELRLRGRGDDVAPGHKDALHTRPAHPPADHPGECRCRSTAARDPRQC